MLASQHMAGQIQRISISTNNECVISAFQKDVHTMLPYWQVRISEVTKHREDLAKEGNEVEEVLHVHAEDNPAELATRRPTQLSKLGSHSKWQTGPSFLRATFNQCLRHDQDYSPIIIDTRSPVKPEDVAAARKILCGITAASAIARLPTSIGNSVRFNWPHVTGESQQFIHTVGNPPSQCRSLGTHMLLRV